MNVQLFTSVLSVFGIVCSNKMACLSDTVKDICFTIKYFKYHSLYKHVIFCFPFADGNKKTSLDYRAVTIIYCASITAAETMLTQSSEGQP